MKQARNNSSNGSYQLTDKGKRFVRETRPVPLKLTAQGVAFVKDHKAKLGAIPEDENLPRAASHQSHVDLINEEIELAENALKGEQLVEALMKKYEGKEAEAEARYQALKSKRTWEMDTYEYLEYVDLLVWHVERTLRGFKS